MKSAAWLQGQLLHCHVNSPWISLHNPKNQAGMWMYTGPSDDELYLTGTQVDVIGLVQSLLKKKQKKHATYSLKTSIVLQKNG